MAKITISDVARAIQRGEDTKTIDGIIQQNIDDYQLGITVSKWREVNYKNLRSWAYPPIGDQLDALLKYLDGSVGLPVELTSIISKWKQVKEEYPISVVEKQ